MSQVITRQSPIKKKRLGPICLSCRYLIFPLVLRSGKKYLGRLKRELSSPAFSDESALDRLNFAGAGRTGGTRRLRVWPCVGASPGPIRATGGRGQLLSCL